MTTPKCLVISGILNTNSIWPHGLSDADTIRLTVNTKQPWSWIWHNGIFRRTRMLDKAEVHGAFVKPVVSNTSTVSIRFEGIDAPELHYRAPPRPIEIEEEDHEKQITYRQPFGETASVGLYQLLSPLGEQIPVEIWTAVNDPSEAFDCYGRLVGQVFVKINSKLFNVNHWLLENGLAFPALYTSMRWEEITPVIRLTKAARTQRKGVWARYSRTCGPVDPRVVYRGKGAELHQENGAIMVPKFFRRRVAWREHCHNVAEITFEKYLQQRGDRFVLISEFSHGASERDRPWRALNQVFEQGEITVDPLTMVFEERASRLST